MPTNHLGRVIAIVLILFGAIWCVFPGLVPHPLQTLSPKVPLSEKLNLKPGIDLVGGTSLLYEIKPPPGGATPPDLAERVMDALKKRIDPDGVRNLVWRPQGSNKLEIQMPHVSTSENAQAVRKELSEAQSALETTNISPLAVVDAAQRLKGEARASRLNALAMDSETRRSAFAAIAEAADKIEAARAKQDAAAQAAAEAAFDVARAKIQPTNVDVQQLKEHLTTIEQAKAKQAENPKAPAPAADVLAIVQGYRDATRDFPSQQAALGRYIDAYQKFYVVKDQIDDAASLKRELQGSGVLEFHITVDAADPRVSEMAQRIESGQGTAERGGDTCRWYKIDKPEQFKNMGSKAYVVREYAGKLWMLLDNRPEKCMTQHTGGGWALTDAHPQQDPQSGNTVVAFRLDARGGIYMGKLTGNNVNRPMAILLDDKVISAPNINSQINDQGVIQGQYTPEELKYLVNTLNAGSLPATLADEPISERSIGSSVGSDNLKSGFHACGFGLLVVGAFLLFYYRLSGLVALVAVLMNLVLILGAMAAINATFTLPGIAALILTLGTAVDANVLIFERLREEQHRGFPLKTAMAHAYDRAWSAIVDSNTVTAIVSLVLYLLGSEEVKGFGLTLLIGIAASLFTSLFVTKTIFAILIEKFGIKHLSSLPEKIPALERALRPHFDWMGKIRILGAVSVVVLLVGLGLFAHYTNEGQMMDIEFASGTSVTIDLKEPAQIHDVRKTIEEAGSQVVAIGADKREKIEEALPAPQVVPVGGDGKSYEIVTPSTDVPAVRSAILEAFGEKLDIRRPSTFDKVGTPFESADGSVLFVVGNAPPASRFVPERWGEFRGGVAIYLNNISPQMTPKQIQEAINAERLMPGSNAGAIPQPVVISPTGGDKPTGEAVVLAVNPQISGDEDREKWRAEIAEPLWKLVGDALNQPPKLAKVSNFNAQVAGGFKLDAAMAIGISIAIIMFYVWLRFGKMSYGWANTMALFHDTLFIIAALGFAHLLFNLAPGLAKGLLIEQFRINLTVVAGILTIMGYSMVDTIVVFDRIRELRGPRGVALTKQTINDAINQTLSRTLLTAGTTVATLFVMYMFGGAGIHGFTYVLLIGILVGTYSSVVIAAPMLLIGMGRKAPAAK